MYEAEEEEETEDDEETLEEEEERETREYESYKPRFGDLKAFTAVRLTKETRNKLLQIGKKQNRTLSEVIRYFLNKYMDNFEKYFEKREGVPVSLMGLEEGDEVW